MVHYSEVRRQHKKKKKKRRGEGGGSNGRGGYSAAWSNGRACMQS